MMKKINQIIWKDRKIYELLLLFLFIIGSIFAIFGIVVSDKDYKIFFGIWLLFSFYLIYIYYFRRKLTYINNKGIIIGNLTFRKLNTYDPIQNPELIEWDSIKSILIKGKLHGSRSLAIDYLYVFKKKVGKVECRLYNPKGFVEALKKINRYHLLSKDSKYR